MPFSKPLSPLSFDLLWNEKGGVGLLFQCYYRIIKVLAVVCISRFAPHSFTLYRDVAIIVYLSEMMVQPATNNNRPFVCFTLQKCVCVRP